MEKRPPPPDVPVAFHLHGLTKTYRSGEIDIQALRGVDLDIFGPNVDLDGILDIGHDLDLGE